MWPTLCPPLSPWHIHVHILTEDPFFLLLIPPKRNLSPATRLPRPFFLASLAPLVFFLTPGPGIVRRTEMTNTAAGGAFLPCHFTEPPRLQ